MTNDELRAIDQRLAAMSDRVDAVIEKESRGKPMPVLDFKPRVNSEKQGARPPVGMSLHPHAGGSRARYVPAESDIEPMWAYERPRSEDCIEQIFADFERQFDEMAQAHRWRA